MVIGKREFYLALALGILAVNVVIGWHFYDVGRRNIELKATKDSLVVVRKEEKVISNQRDSVGKLLAVANTLSEKTRTIYISTRNTTTIKGDSAYDSTGHFIQVLDHRITQRIVAAENHVSNLETQLALSSKLLRIDTVFIAKKDQDIKLNTHIAGLESAPVLSHGFQVGVGYCLTLTGGTPCLYAGYGFSVRF